MSESGGFGRVYDDGVRWGYVWLVLATIALLINIDQSHYPRVFMPETVVIAGILAPPSLFVAWVIYVKVRERKRGRGKRQDLLSHFLGCAFVSFFVSLWYVLRAVFKIVILEPLKAAASLYARCVSQPELVVAVGSLWLWIEKEFVAAGLFAIVAAVIYAGRALHKIARWYADEPHRAPKSTPTFRAIGE